MPHFPRITAVICAVIFTLTALTACQGESQTGDTDELLQAVTEALGDSKGRGIIYFDRTRNPENEDLHRLSEEQLGYLYTGRIEPLPCQARIAAYALWMPSDTGGCEIHVIECQNPSDTEEIALFLQKRIDKLKSSEILSIAPENRQNCFKSAEVYRKGRFAFLLATPNNASAKRAINSLL